MQITIDGKRCEASPGQTVLAVARAHGFYVPTLCYHAKTGKAGKCRACVAEIAGMRGLQTTCTVEVKDGMVVRLDSEKVRKAQRLVVDLLLSSGRHDCLSCEKNGECELQAAAYYLGVKKPSFAVANDEAAKFDDTSRFVVRDDAKCIKCGRCVAGCKNTVCNDVLDFGFRSGRTKVICDHDQPMGASTCVQCGECVQLCPVGALVDKKAVGQGRVWDLAKVNTTCPYCGVGCQVTMHVDRPRNRIVKVTGRECAPNEGMLCVKGRYGYDFPSHPERLKYPMIKRDGVHVRVSWDEALDYTADRIRTIVGQHGPDVFSAFGSGRITNENNYALAKFTRAVIHTNNIDHCART
jgi:formate dehydrogenase major subunit